MSAPEFNGIVSSVLRPKLACIGYVKIGGKGKEVKSGGGKKFNIPEKYDHFRIRTRVRGADNNYLLDKGVHDRIGPAPTEIDIRFLWDEPEQNFKTSLTAWQDSKVRCQGNGARAFDRVLNKEIQCTCPLLRQHKGDYPLKSFPRPVGQVQCKPYGVLSFFLEAASVYGGFHVFRTTSWETINSLTEALKLFKQNFGILSWIPFKLIVYPHTVQYEENGQAKTSKAYAVSLVLRGNMEAAFQIAARAQAQRATALQITAGEYTPEQHAEAVQQVEQEDSQEIVSEFHPAAGVAESDSDYETVSEDEEAHPLEEWCRLALQLAKYTPDKINKQIAKYSDEISSLALKLEAELPSEWKQAGEQLVARQDEAAREEANRGLANQALELFS